METKKSVNIFLAFLSTLIPLIKGFGENLIVFGVLSAIFNFFLTLLLWNAIPEKYWYKLTKPYRSEPLTILTIPLLFIFLCVIFFSFDFLVLIAV